MSANGKLAVLCVQTRLLGNITYGMLLRQLFGDSAELDFRAVWSNDTRELLPRLVHRALTFPGNHIGTPRVNLDFWGTRFEFAASSVARAVLRKALDERPADVLHLHTQNIAWRSIDLMHRMPTVISADMTAMQSAEQETAPQWRWTSRPRELFERRAFRAASAVVAFSHWAADSIRSGHGVEGSRIHVIHPGIRRSEFAEIASDARTCDRDACRILFVGGEFERKGGPLLLDVFLAQFAAAAVDLDIVTHSDIPIDHPRVHVHRDVVPFSDRWRMLYQKANMLVVPTSRDASSHVAIEAMASGLPVVTTGIGGIPEIVVDGENGFLIEPDDGTLLAHRIGRLIGDAHLRTRMGNVGRARVERDFDATVNGSRLARLYATVHAEWN